MIEKLIPTDLKILNHMLEFDSQNISKIAKELNLPPSTIHKRINALKEKGLIKRMVPELDTDKLGLPTLALIEIDVIEQSIIPKLDKRFGNSANVVISLGIYGNYDYLLGVYVSSDNELDDLRKELEHFPGVKMVYATIVGTKYRFSTIPFPLKVK